MSADNLSLYNPIRSKAEKVSIRNSMIDFELRFDGHNVDIVEAYYWHLHFAYFVGKGYFPLKLEDYHYFSENSQFGTNMRQVKGGTIRAFQENLNQLIQLIKVHLMPLLKEVKQAEFYDQWMKEITENDNKVQELKTKGVPNDNADLLKYRNARNEAINHIKDKWVNEIDGGRLWQMNRPAAEQGLDFALLPQLFFGINLDDPLCKKKSIKEQLDEDIYTVDISLMAKEQVARFMYRFYTWLPTAVRETQVTYRIKIASLKQFYAQIQMYINFMKPLLMEIARKSEGFEKSNAYRNFDLDNPEVVALFDYSYSFIKLMGVRNFARLDFNIHDLEFTKYGLYVRSARDSTIKFGNHKGKSGFIMGETEDKKKYEFLEFKDGRDKMTDEKFKELLEKWVKNPVYVNKEELLLFPIMEMDFSQKRRMEMLKTDQGAQQVPYMRNQINYSGKVWNIYELAAYREKLKIDDLKLLETFIDEVRVVREELIKYVGELQGSDELSKKKEENKEEPKKEKEKKDWTLITGPFEGIGELLSPLKPDLGSGFRKKEKKKSKDQDIEDHEVLTKLSMVEDIWKVYNVFKKAHGFMQY